MSEPNISYTTCLIWSLVVAAFTAPADHAIFIGFVVSGISYHVFKWMDGDDR